MENTYTDLLCTQKVYNNNYNNNTCNNDKNIRFLPASPTTPSRPSPGSRRVIVWQAARDNDARRIILETTITRFRHYATQPRCSSFRRARTVFRVGHDPDRLQWMRFFPSAATTSPRSHYYTPTRVPDSSRGKVTQYNRRRRV